MSIEKMLFYLFVILASCCLSDAFESSDKKFVEKYLTDFYGFNEKTDNLSEAIKVVQKLAGINEDGRITSELVAHLSKSRCGKEDKEKKSKRYQLMPTKWDKGTTYRFYIHDGRHPRTMSTGAMIRAITLGVQYWSTAADIYFGQISSTRGALFSISFADAEHTMYDVHNNFAPSRDPFPLDNVPGNVLAHAFNPRNGNLHLDSAEEWTEGTDNGINLRLVTAHEMGHAIGLYHSNLAEALMYPAYTGYVSEDKFKLPRDDAQGAIAIYGPRKGLRYVRSEEKIQKRSENENELCDTPSINGAFEFTDGHVYVISKDNNVFRIVNHTIDPDFKPFKIQENLQNVDAIFLDHVKMRLIVFKGEKMFSATGLNLNKLTVSELTILKRNRFQGFVTAAFPRVNENEPTILRFWAVQNGKLISGEVEGGSVKFYHSYALVSDILKMSGGGHLPPSIDGAFVTGRDDEFRLVLFVGNSVYVGKPSGRREVVYTIPAEYPKSFKQVIGC